MILEKIGVKILWFDSMGVKSSSIYIDTECGGVIIDPGAAVMHPSYPLPSITKKELRRKALSDLVEYLEKAKIVIITHYHHDHFFYPSDKDLKLFNIDVKSVFENKLLIVKNPNKYINESQWGRARKFFAELLSLYGKDLGDYLVEPRENYFQDPVNSLECAIGKDFGEYSSRRLELLERGREWFNKLTRLWIQGRWIEEFHIDNIISVKWGDNSRINYCGIEISILEPWFHGIEYDRAGWITPLIIKRNNVRIFYSSDVMGPIIEDYAEYIAKLKPDVVILDGPPTYLYPYMFNRINLRRAIENAITIIHSRPSLIIYDHHLLREKKWRERVKEVFVEAGKIGVEIITAAEYLGKKPLIDTI